MVYGFSLNYTGTKVLYKLKALDCCYIVYSNNIDHYLDMLLHDQPEFILGLGGYFGTDQDFIKIKTMATKPLKSFLKPCNEVENTSGLGNPLCNLVSCKIIQLVNQGKLKSKYTFLYIPNSFPATKAVTSIEEMLKAKAINYEK